MNLYKTQDRPYPKFIANGKKNEYFTNVIKTFMGRDALRVFLYNTRPNKVLIPAYNCQEVINEFLRSNCEIHYYDINEDFSIDCEKIADTIKSKEIDLFYFLVYFGIANNNNNIAKEIKQICPNVIIIEDRAQYLSNNYDTNNCDAYIFSFRKLLPITEGGGIYTNRTLEINFSGKLQSNILPILMYLKKKILGYNDKYNRTSLTNDKFHNSVMPISIHSQNVIDRYDYRSEIEFRRDCYIQWVEVLKGSNIKPVFETIEDDDIPQGCPIYVKNSERVQEYLRQKKYYLRRHWKLDEKMLKIAPVSYSISNKIITLPIYKGINGKIQNRIVEFLKECNSSGIQV